MSDPHHPKEGEIGTGEHKGMKFIHGKWVKIPDAHKHPEGEAHDHGKEHH
jgi:hypothetical protein